MHVCVCVCMCVCVKVLMLAFVCPIEWYRSVRVVLHAWLDMPTIGVCIQMKMRLNALVYVRACNCARKLTRVR